LGVLLGLGSGLAYAGVVIGMRGLRGADPVWLSAVNNVLGALALGAAMTAASHVPPLPSPPQALALVAFGTVQMALPYTLFARGLREVTAAEAGLITLVEPILNPVWVVLVAHERPGAPTMLGGLLLLTGVACRYLPVRARPTATDPAPVPGDGPALP
jgi:drug/metabolite transporter (DMT)-like permease